MKKTSIFLFAFIFAFAAILSAQQNLNSNAVTPPLFPYGNDSLALFIYSNLQYPDSAFVENIEGKVVCGFEIDTFGVVSNPSILRKVHPWLDTEAIRIVSLLPNWIPATQNNAKIISKSAVTIIFDIEKEKEKAISMGEFVDAQFPGGIPEMRKFLVRNINYPVDAQRQGIYGRVICTFVVEKDGTLKDITVENKTHPSLEFEAKRIISVMPRWIP